MNLHRTAVIGYGRWGPNHARNVSQIESSELVAVVDPDAHRKDEAANLNTDISVFSDVRDLLKWGSFDTAIVATPADNHFQTVSMLLEEGKHVLCEKPLTRVTEETLHLVHLARRGGLVLMVGNVFLFNGGIRYLKKIIQEGQIGDVRYASCIRTNLGPVRTDVNAALDLAAHDVSIIDYLTDQMPAWVSATGKAYLRCNVEDVVFITLGYESNFICHMEVSWLNPRKVRQITLVGTNKMACWDDLAMDRPVTIYDRGVEEQRRGFDYGEFLRASIRDGDVYMPKVDGRQPLLLEDAAFFDAVNGIGEGYCDAMSALRQNVVLDAICASILGRGSAIEIVVPKVDENAFLMGIAAEGRKMGVDLERAQERMAEF